MWSNPTLSQWAQACHGQLVGADFTIGQISTDTRTLKAGDVYVALCGEHFDGHDYIDAALKKGASSLVVNAAIESSVPQLVVSDTTQALGALAGLLRSRFKGQVIALTGSAGKTSTREMLSCILNEIAPTLTTEGNFNNEIGAPKTWFALNESHEQVLLELGANAQGEIARMGAFSSPNISLLLNAAEAHTEGFGGIEGVRLGKGEIISATKSEGVCVLNRDDSAFSQWKTRAEKRRVVTFGEHDNADVRLCSYQHTPKGGEFTLSLPEDERLAIQWPVFGRHMALNAAAAAATAWAAGVSLAAIKLGLSKMRPQPGRLEPVTSCFGGPLIHDAYNANPFSMRSAIDLLSQLSSHTILVAGEMGELGDHSAQMHAEVGQYAQGKVTQLLAVGERAKPMADAFGSESFIDIDAVVEQLKTVATAKTAVLVKGSRSAGLERVVNALKGEQ